METRSPVAAIVPAAGLSRRMGGDTPKPLLPWGDGTVIGRVTAVLRDAGLDDIVVVTGHRRELFEALLRPAGVRCVPNPDFAAGDMLSSIKAGLQALPAGCRGALIALADQPQIEPAVVRAVLDAFDQHETLVVPSYRMRRGHPLLLPRWLWPEALALPDQASLRALLERRAADIHYVVVGTPSVLADLDTPEQYREAVSRACLSRE